MSAIAVAEMMAVFSADVSRLNKAFDGVEKQVNGFGNTFGVFDKIATGAFLHIGAVAVDAVGKAFEKVGDIAAQGIEFNAMQEQASTAFETMLGSAGAAQSFLSDMQKFAKTTPFEYPELLTASRRMMALGFAADEVLPLLTSIGNATAAMGGSQEMIDRVTTALGQMRSKGKVQAEEMMQLTENGIAAWDMLARKLGTDVATAMDMVTKRQVDAATGIEAIQEGIDSRFGGMMQKQSSSWDGMISNLKDSFGMLSGQVMKPFFNVAEKGLKWLVDLTSSDRFTNGVTKFTENITNVLDRTGAAVGAFRDRFSLELATITSDNAAWGQRMEAIWHIVATSGNDLWQSIIDNVVNAWPTWQDNISKWAVSLWNWIVEAAPKALTAIGNWAAGIWNWLVQNGPPWLATLDAWGRTLWQWISNTIPTVKAKLGEWRDTVFGWLTQNGPTWVNTLAGWGQAALGFVQSIGGVISAIGTIFQPIADAVLSFVTWKDVVIAAGIAIAVAMWPAVTAAVAAIGSFVAAWGPVVLLFAGATLAVAALRTAWETDFGGIQTKTKAVFDYIGSVFGPLLTTIQQFGGDALREIVAWAVGQETQFTAVGLIWEATKTAFGTLFTDMGTAITTFVNGAWTQFSERFPVAAQTFTDTWEATKTAFVTAQDLIVGALNSLEARFGPLLTTIQTFGVGALAEIANWALGNQTNFENVQKIWDVAKNTFTIVFNEIIAKLREWGNEAWNWFSTKFPKAADALNTAVATIQTKFKQLWDVVGPIITSAISKFQEWVTKWKSGTLDMSGAFDRAMSVIDGVWAVMVRAAQLSIGTILDSLKLVSQLLTGDWSGAWETAKKLVNGVFLGLTDIVARSVESILQALGLNWTDVMTWRDNFVSAVTRVIDTIKKIGQPILDMIAKFYSWKDVVTLAGGAVAVAFGGTMLGAIGAAVTAIGGFLAAWVPVAAILAGAVTAIAIVRQAWDENWGGIQEKTFNVLNQVKSGIQFGLKAISDWFFKESGLWHGSWEETFEYFAWWVAGGWKMDIYFPLRSALISLGSEFDIFKTYASNKIAEWAQKAKDTFAGWKNDAVEKFTQWKDIVMEKINDFIDLGDDISLWVLKRKQDFKIFKEDTVDTVIGWKNTIVEKFTEFKDWLTNNQLVQDGKDFIQGLWDGIQIQWYKFLGWFEPEYGRIARDMEKAYDINSPSGVMRDIGINLMTGLQGGIESASAGPLQAIASLATSVNSQVSSMVNAVKNSAGVINGAIPNLGGNGTTTGNNAPPTGGMQILIPPTMTGQDLELLNFGDKWLKDAIKELEGLGDTTNLWGQLSKFAGDAFNAITAATGQTTVDSQTYSDITTLGFAKNQQVDWLLEAIHRLINKLNEAGLGSAPQFNISAAPSADQRDDIELRNLVAYLNAMYAS